MALLWIFFPSQCKLESYFYKIYNRYSMFDAWGSSYSKTSFLVYIITTRDSCETHAEKS